MKFSVIFAALLFVLSAETSAQKKSEVEWLTFAIRSGSEAIKERLLRSKI